MKYTLESSIGVKFIYGQYTIEVTGLKDGKLYFNYPDIKDSKEWRWDNTIENFNSYIKNGSFKVIESSILNQEYPIYN